MTTTLANDPGRVQSRATLLLGSLWRKLLQFLGSSPKPAAQHPADLPGGSCDTLLPSTVPAEVHAALPDYRVDGVLGKGNMGVVYAAFSRKLGRYEAIKVLNRDLLTLPGEQVCFRRGIQAAASLNHPNIVKVRALVDVDGVLGFSMEYVKGMNLAQVVKSRHQVSVVEACDYAQQAASGLQAMHAQNIVHRDIKPDNLILAYQDEKHVVKITDFGLAKVQGEQQPEVTGTLIDAGAVKGTPSYMSPDQWLDSKSVDIRADIYSLGCTLYFLLTGRPPFVGTVEEVREAHKSLDAKPLNKVRKEVPAALAKVVAKMMAKEPAQRYQTPKDVVEALAPFVRGGKKGPNWLKWLMLLVPVVMLIGAILLLVYRVGVKTPEGVATLKPGEKGGKQVAPGDGSLSAYDLTGGYRFVHFGPNGPRVVLPFEDGKVYYARVYDLSTHTQVTPPLKHDDKVLHAAFSPDGKRVVTASDDRTARVWDAATGKPVTRPLEHDDTVLYAAFSPDGRWVVTTSKDKSARVWDATTGDAITKPLEHDKEVKHAAFSPDGKRVVTASDDRTARVWDAATGKPVTRPLEHDDMVWHVTFSPDGKRLVTASPDRPARVWDAATYTELILPLNQQKMVRPVVFSSDGKRLVAVGEYHAARRWDAVTGKPIAGLLRHHDRVCHASFSPDGKQVVTASWDKTARVWDAATGKPVTPPLKHDDTVLYAAFSPDGKRVVTVSADKTAREWNVATGGLEVTLWTKTIVNSIGMKLAQIPAGKFTMGSPKGEKGRDTPEKQHEVEITKPFYMGVYEVTQGLFKKVMGYNPSYFSKDGKGKEGLRYLKDKKPAEGKVKDGDNPDDLPVENLSWGEAQTFLKKLSDLPEEKKAGRQYRLPTQQEWEYACRAGTTTPFSFGPALSAKEANFDGNKPYGGADPGPYWVRTRPIGSYKPNGFGLYDMHGNVWEWCDDSKGSDRVIRGGGWVSDGEGCRSASRRWHPPDHRSPYIGFRVVATVPVAR
jgi:WD40 repeat protein